MRQMSVAGMLKTMIPISRFNRGEANKIFDEVETTGTKIVVKNNKPACVLISPTQYESLMEMLSDFILKEEAEERMKHYDGSENRTQEQMMQEFGISQSELDEVDVELE
ncbi:MAG: type II toxin-antitoxin system Phd/YefM family antitoxin [Roseburia sp.]|nr:type II toxin-antitoxin system Phd/YefM family antitoxin [Roseburia sp.]